MRKPEPRNRKYLLRLMAGAFLVYGVLHFAYGTYKAYATDQTPIDYRMRWIEQQYFYKGINPYDVSRHALDSADEAISSFAREHVIDGLGHPVTLGYPASTYPLQAVFAPPGLDYPTSRLLFIALNFLALLVIPLGLSRLIQAHGFHGEEKWLLAFASTGLASVSNTIGNGQYGLIVNAAIVFSAALSRGLVPLSSLGILFAMIKPPNAAPLVLAFLDRNKWQAFVMAGIMGLGVSGIFWIMTGDNPLTVLHQMLTYSESSFATRESLLAWIIRTGVDPIRATVALGVFGVVASLIFILRYANHAMVFKLAGLGFIARIWTKHFLYDDLLIGFLLLALGILFFLKKSRVSLLAVVLVGATLWTPVSFLDHFYGVLFQHLVWIAAFSHLIWNSSYFRKDQAMVDSTVSTGSPCALHTS